MHMCEHYILQPTESSPGTGNSSPQRQRMDVWSGDTWAAGSMHGIAGFDNDEIKDILYYISTIWILILSILFHFNKCTATDQIDDCEYE